MQQGLCGNRTHRQGRPLPALKGEEHNRREVKGSNGEEENENVLESNEEEEAALASSTLHNAGNAGTRGPQSVDRQ